MSRPMRWIQQMMIVAKAEDDDRASTVVHKPTMKGNTIVNTLMEF